MACNLDDQFLLLCTLANLAEMDIQAETLFMKNVSLEIIWFEDNSIEVYLLIL